ncbi:tyrosine-type recombinase/integrase [Vagococcus hydrophili]|uniref:Tyrosine-type recombinase/integrase n=1 Tax=Vagococcus hydrophili TaxID=2714947 RepID=A0A6G8AR51_9ENTE|nr:tyrosine-type recombinase/integrase [Vagococcus hydrophili]QIL47551.1 tyrosine-type recombinase/integrase [Vagococcus hydrophili]
MFVRLNDYKLYCIENEIAANTIKNYMMTLSQLDDFLQNNYVDQVTKEDLIRFKQHLKEDTYAPGKKYKTSTCNQKITAINIYLNWVERSDLKLKLFKEQTTTHRESITQEDFERLLKYSDKEMTLFILTIANTGLRISEVCALKKDDLYSAIIEVRNKGKIRIIDIPSFLKKKLRSYSNNMENTQIIFNKTQSYYRQELKATAGKAKVKLSRVYPHSLRHYFAKKFIADGGDSTALQQMLGHSDIKTTTIYTKMSKEELAKTFRGIKNK